MTVLSTRMNRRTLGALGVGVAATAGAARYVVAQDATPEATPEGPSSILAALENVTQIEVIANTTSYAVFQGGGLAPGWFVFTLTNASEADASLNLVKMPEENSIGDLTQYLAALHGDAATAAPDWVSGATFVGGTFAPVGGSSSALVKLDSPGEWVLFSSHSASQQSPTIINVLTPEELESSYGVAPEATPVGATPVPEAPAPEGFGSSLTVSLTDTAITADAMPALGLSVLGVRNDGASPADLVILHSTDAVDAAAAADLAKSWISGQAPENVKVVGGMGALSPQVYGYAEVTAEAGTFVAFSSLPSAAGTEQVDDGAIIVVPLG